MTKHVWSIELDTQSHTIEFERGLWSIQHTIRVDGQVAHQSKSYVTDFGTDDSIQIGSHVCTFHTRAYWTKSDHSQRPANIANAQKLLDSFKLLKH